MNIAEFEAASVYILDSPYHADRAFDYFIPLTMRGQIRIGGFVHVPFGGGNKPKEDVSAYRLAYPGDIVMNSMNILSGSVGLSKYFGCVSPVYYMLRPFSENEDVRFYNYIFQTTVFQRSLFGLGNGILMKESGNGKLNTIRMRIPMDKFGGLFIPVAPPDEQKKIADYLDIECKKIDDLALDIQSQIDVLEQYKKTTITESVTKGIREYDEYKESSIQWIGLIPKHWSCIRGKYILRYIQKKSYLLPLNDNQYIYHKSSLK